MRSRALSFVLAVTFMAFPPGRLSASETPAASPSESAQGKEVKAKLESLFAASKKVDDPKEKQQARRTVETGLDWDRIALSCLGATRWKKLSAATRDQFKTLLKQVITETAFSRMGKFWQDGTQYQFTKIKAANGQAEVKTRFKPKRGDAVILVYYVAKTKGQWLINDAAVDDLRYSETINEQITTFLNEKKAELDQTDQQRQRRFGELLDKLKKRLKEIHDADATETKT